MTIRIYIEEDSLQHALVAALRGRGADVLTAAEAGMMERDDAEHLAYATSQGRVLYTRNGGDFYHLHTECLTQGQSHAGIMIGRHAFSIGDQLRGLLRLIARRSAEQMTNQAGFLSAWLRPTNGDGET